MKNLSTQQLKRMMEHGDNFKLVDVLPPKDFAQFHLPGSINVPLSGDFDEKVKAALPRLEQPVVVYCRDSTCDASPRAAERLESLGYKAVFDYGDGKNAWKDARLPVNEGP